MDDMSTVLSRAMFSSCRVHTASDRSWCSLHVVVGKLAITCASSASLLSSGAVRKNLSRALAFYVMPTSPPVTFMMRLMCSSRLTSRNMPGWFHFTLPRWQLFRAQIQQNHIPLCAIGVDHDCRVLSLSDRRYSLNPLSQTRIDWVGRYRIWLTFKLSCVWH